MKVWQGELVLISCGEGDVIKDQLSVHGIPERLILIPDIACIDKSAKDFDFIWDNIEVFNGIYEQLADEKSKKVFSNVLNYKICHDSQLIYEIYDDSSTQYFDKELVKFNKKDVFVDCGSYTGDTIEMYLKYCEGKYEKIIGFEADKDNFDILEKKVNENTSMDIYNIGVWNKTDNLKFNNIGSGSGKIDREGSINIHVDSIDNILVNVDNVSLIKMDIEGSEMEALIGAYETIVKWKPTLMISVYHKKEDFIRIPMLIKAMNPNYQIYFRHYRKESVQETVCYAIL